MYMFKHIAKIIKNTQILWIRFIGEVVKKKKKSLTYDFLFSSVCDW